MGRGVYGLCPFLALKIGSFFNGHVYIWYHLLGFGRHGDKLALYLMTHVRYLEEERIPLQGVNKRKQ